jgi:hypothetical protein
VTIEEVDGREDEKYMIKINVPGGREYVLKGETNIERKEWVKAIQESGLQTSAVSKRRRDRHGCREQLLRHGGSSAHERFCGATP